MASNGDDVLSMYAAILRGQSYPPPGVADTPENLESWESIKAEVDAMPENVAPYIPWNGPG